MRKSTIATVSAIAFSVAGMASAESWDMPMAYAATNYHTEHGVMFADKVRELTNGEIDITVHPGGSLFGGADIKRAIQTSQVPIGERLMSAHANETPILGWDSLPFEATTFEANEKLWQAAKEPVGEALDEQNLVTLYTCPWPGQGFYFKNEVKNSKDIAGVKFRSYNAATAEIAERLGMIPVQVEAAELSQALATGVAEAFISSGSTGYDRKVWEHLNYYYKVNAWLPRNYVMINKGVWDGLDDDKKQALQSAADEVAASCLAKAEELSDWYFAQLAENGMQVVDAGDEFRAELEEIGSAMTDAWVEQTGDAGQKLLDTYRQ